MKPVTDVVKPGQFFKCQWKMILQKAGRDGTHWIYLFMALGLRSLRLRSIVWASITMSSTNTHEHSRIFVLTSGLTQFAELFAAAYVRRFFWTIQIRANTSANRTQELRIDVSTHSFASSRVYVVLKSKEWRIDKSHENISTVILLLGHSKQLYEHKYYNHKLAIGY